MASLFKKAAEVFVSFFGVAIAALFSGPLLDALVGLLFGSGVHCRFNIPTAEFFGVIGLVFGGLAFYVIGKTYRWSVHAVVFGIIGILFGLLFATSINDNPHSCGRGYDSRVFGDLKQLQVALELYADPHESKYPPLPEGCHDISILDASLAPAYIPAVPRARGYYAEPNYGVAVSRDQMEYVLRGTLINKYASSLDNDIDGNRLGCDCDDPNICFAP